MLVLPPVSQGRIAMLASQFTSEDMNTLTSPIRKGVRNTWHHGQQCGC